MHYKRFNLINQLVIHTYHDCINTVVSFRLTIGVENPPNDIVGVINEVAQDEGELDQEEEEVERVNPVPEEGIYMNLVHASTMVQVDKLEAYIKERDTIRDGFVPEYNVRPGCSLLVYCK